MSRLDLAIITAALVGGAVLLEGGHRIVIDAPSRADAATRLPAACADSDNVPYSAACIAFLEGRAPDRPGTGE
jgi:predicted secreted protein